MHATFWFLLLLSSCGGVIILGTVLLIDRQKKRFESQQRQLRQSVADGEMIANGQVPPQYQHWVSTFQALQTDEERDTSLRQFLSRREEQR
ncbi:MAG: hypothetical protein H0U76_11920 [Ktedonobacteraceae bacterium]|nr:hypothetical protein [Ktedonobacteraceae bacterium]